MKRNSKFDYYCASPEKMSELIARIVKDADCKNCPASKFCMNMDNKTPVGCKEIILAWLKSKANRK